MDAGCLDARGKQGSFLKKCMVVRCDWCSARRVRKLFSVGAIARRLLDHQTRYWSRWAAPVSMTQPTCQHRYLTGHTSGTG